MRPVITAFERSPDGGKGLARDTRVRWALEEVSQPYDVRLLLFAAMKDAAHLALVLGGCKRDHRKEAQLMKLMFSGLVALCLTECGQRSTSVDYHANGGQTITIADAKNGSVKAEIGATAAMPTDLPAWVPQYPGSTIMVAQIQSQAAGHGPLENVTMQTPDSLSRVSAFYDLQIAKAGLKPMHSVGDADASTRMVQTPSEMVSVGVVKDDEGGSLISISRIKE